MLAVLCSDEVYQSAACEVGALWKNCDDTDVEVYDSETGQIGDDNFAPYEVDPQCASVAIRVSDESGLINAGRFEQNSITFEIDLIVNESSGHKRQNTLDEIQMRVLYRILNTTKIKDANSESVYKSPLCMARRNEVRFTVRDDSESYSCTTVRTLTFTLDVEECINKGNCDDRLLCFDFDALTKLSKDGDDVFVSVK